MKLMTKEIENKFKKVGRQDRPDPLIIAKFFYPAGASTWYATEYDPQDRIFFGFADPLGDPSCAEWGSFSLDELEAFRGHFGLGIERDIYFGYQLVSECSEIQKRMGK
jgi:hypothetical protein